ncbi:ferritin family protein [Candidatus Neomarinimicrobiota bacterium]
MPSRTTEHIPEYLSLEDILTQAIDHEQESHDYYAAAAKRTVEPELRRLLIDLAKVELEHKQALKEQLEQLQSTQEIAQDLIYSFGGQNQA